MTSSGQEEDTGNQEKLPPEIRQEVVAGQTQAEGNVRTPHAIPEETVSSQKETVAIPEETVATPKETVPIPKETVPTQEENMGERVKQETGELQPGKTGETIDWKALTETILKEKTPGKISQLFEKIWDKEMARNWLLEPEMVADKKNIKEFYDKLSHQMKQLEKIFEDGSLGKSPVMKAVQNTVSNLDFMNQLNQMHAYIQLPLKMANQNAHGELYVFTNKKNLTKQEGKVTALLHLDMEHLGKMDVYVALENKKVNTNFYLEKEEYLVTSRLNQRGYTCEVKTTLRNEEPEPMMKIIEKQQGTSMMMSMQAFDVRA